MNHPRLKFLQREIENFEEIIRYLKPSSGDIPRLEGIDMFGGTTPLNGVIGGDHLVYVDFNRRFDLDRRIQAAKNSGREWMAEKLAANKLKAGMLIADVSGHRITDALMAAMLHQAFLLGVRYELSMWGEVTTELFENINTRFFNSSSISKFITMIYGEIHQSGMFHFVSAGHPDPVVFSHSYNKLMTICSDRVVRFPPIGTMPSRDDIDFKRNQSRLGYKKKYAVSEINLMGRGDILLLYTDGLSDHCDDGDRPYFPRRVEEILQGAKEKTAAQIYDTLKSDLLSFAPPSDDVGLLVIKKLM